MQPPLNITPTQWWVCKTHFILFFILFIFKMSVKNILDGTITIESKIPEKLTTTDIIAERVVQGNVVMADDALRSNRYVIAGTETGDITKIEKGHI